MTFAPLLTVPICTLGLAISNRSGLLEVCLKAAGETKSQWLLTMIVAFIGVNANLVEMQPSLYFHP
jgi:aminobenzoyl-glutamate transport protein